MTITMLGSRADCEKRPKKLQALFAAEVVATVYKDGQVVGVDVEVMIK